MGANDEEEGAVDDEEAGENELAVDELVGRNAQLDAAMQKELQRSRER